MGKIANDLPCGVLISPLKKIYNPKGNLFHVMKATDSGYFSFGEAYFTTVNCGDIKGWKKHLKMVLNLVVIVGEVDFFIHDEVMMTTYSVRLSRENYSRLTIPSGYWVSFEGVSDNENIVLNLASIEHDENESINVPINSFPIV
ncbi:WxcM-like domain-containing protein [Yersinia mollaretii]|uniref:WxcM-like domain-containing protein n=1 Tax=Yersinia mollaretii TaxID=33060 RepID=UPI00119EEDFD|nr:WxcM-like domain-containing protein [Yersinia mollaretii]